MLTRLAEADYRSEACFDLFDISLDWMIMRKWLGWIGISITAQQSRMNRNSEHSRKDHVIIISYKVANNAQGRFR